MTLPLFVSIPIFNHITVSQPNQVFRIRYWPSNRIELYFCHVLFTIQQYFSVVIKQAVWLFIKPGSTHHFFLKCLVQSQEYDSCYQIVSLYVSWHSFECTSVFLFFCFHLIVDVFPSVLVSNPKLFYLTRFMTLNTVILLLPLFSMYFFHRVNKGKLIKPRQVSFRC